MDFVNASLLDDFSDFNYSIFNLSGLPPVPKGFHRGGMRLVPPDSSMVQDIAPPSAVHHIQIRVTSAIYFFLFVFGLCGNVSVLTIISQICRSLRKMETAFIYVAVLSIVDTLVVLSLPLAICDMLLGHWIFGTGLCKIHWLMESAGKILSTFILTAMAWDRYVGVCHPYSPSVRTPRVSLLIVSILIALALGLLSPLPYFAESSVVARSNALPASANGGWVQFTTIKCRLSEQSMRRMTAIGFTWYIFVLGHAVPAVLSAYFYGRILFKIGLHRKRSSANSRISMRRVAFYTLAISIFYFCCWTPYWAAILYIRFLRSSNAAYGGETETFVYVMYVVHALPFVNSAFNWLFYALLNTQLRRTRKAVAEKNASCYHSVGCTRGPAQPVSNGIPASHSRQGLEDDGSILLTRKRFSAEDFGSDPVLKYRTGDTNIETEH